MVFDLKSEIAAELQQVKDEEEAARLAKLEIVRQKIDTRQRRANVTALRLIESGIDESTISDNSESLAENLWVECTVEGLSVVIHSRDREHSLLYVENSCVAIFRTEIPTTGDLQREIVRAVAKALHKEQE